ncbi:MAG: metallophosphoesterase [Ruminococcus sp.]|nr:metallophosphoesterase [Ruminococcus sp.]
MAKKNRKKGKAQKQQKRPVPVKAAPEAQTTEAVRPAEPEKPAAPEVLSAEKPAEAEAVRPTEPEKPAAQEAQDTVSPEKPEPPEKKRKRRRKKPKEKRVHITPFILLGIMVAVIVGCLLNIRYCETNFEVNFYQAESTHVVSDVRLVVISDLHLREYGKDNETLVNAVKSLRPDLIISAGDLVTFGESDYDNMLSLCKKLSEIAPFYGAMGNHEDEKVYLENNKQLREQFAATGMKLLVNTCEEITVKKNKIELIGVSGGVDEYEKYGGEALMESLDDDSSALRICVAHVPTLFKKRLEKYRFDLGIAGHTHGGVVRLPVVGGLYSAEEGFLPEYDGGLYELDNGATLFVSRGLGSSGKIPRFNNTPELAVIDIRWY